MMVTARTMATTVAIRTTTTTTTMTFMTTPISMTKVKASDGDDNGDDDG